MFNEAECPETSEDADEEDTVAVTPHQRRRGKRAPLPDILPRVEVVYDLDDEDKVCPHDGHTLHRIGEETSEQLDVIPAKIQILRHVRVKYGCRCCEQTIKTAPLPPQPIPKEPGVAWTTHTNRRLEIRGWFAPL